MWSKCYIKNWSYQLSFPKHTIYFKAAKSGAPANANHSQRRFILLRRAQFLPGRTAICLASRCCICAMYTWLPLPATRTATDRMHPFCHPLFTMIYWIAIDKQECNDVKLKPHDSTVSGTKADPQRTAGLSHRRINIVNTRRAMKEVKAERFPWDNLWTTTHGTFAKLSPGPLGKDSTSTPDVISSAAFLLLARRSINYGFWHYEIQIK